MRFGPADKACRNASLAPDIALHHIGRIGIRNVWEVRGEVPCRYPPKTRPPA